MPGTWPRDVSDGAGLPDGSRAAVRAWLERTPSSRMLYVRRPGRDRAGTRLAFVVRASDETTEVRRIELSSPEGLADLDLSRAGEVTSAQLVLICGHGTRDTCCAVRGTAVYAALASRLEPDQLWISSHQGGHRFAANVLVLPAGIHLGRLMPDTAPHVGRSSARRRDRPRALPRADGVPAGGTGGRAGGASGRGPRRSLGSPSRLG